jgi:homoserine O-acetyltransferase
LSRTSSRNFIPGADANDLILQVRTWERHDVGATKGFDGRYEAGFIRHVTLTPIPSLWGHPAGAGADAADARFLNQHIAAFLRSNR